MLRDRLQPARPQIWYIGGEDVELRIPLLLALRERGFDVGAIGSQNGNVFARHDIPYRFYPLKRWLDPLADLKACRVLHRLLLELYPDVIHAFDTKPVMLAPLVARQAGVPVRMRTVTGMGYVFSDNSPTARLLRPVYRNLHRLSSRATTVTVFQNSDDQRYFRQQGMVPSGGDTLVAGSGIDIDGFLNRCPPTAQLQQLRQQLGLANRPVVTLIARLVKQKGVVEYLEAAAEVARRRPDITFLLVGPQASEGSQAVPLDQVKTAPDNVRYLGARDDVPALLAISDLCVLPSYREGIPRVLLEASALGLPLIATDVPGCREVVRDGWNGRLIPARNGTAIAQAVLELLSDEPLRRQMGEHSRQQAERFSLDRVADRYSELYHRALRPQQPVPGAGSVYGPGPTHSPFTE